MLRTSKSYLLLYRNAVKTGTWFNGVRDASLRYGSIGSPRIWVVNRLAIKFTQSGTDSIYNQDKGSRIQPSSVKRTKISYFLNAKYLEVNLYPKLNWGLNMRV